MNQCGQWPPQQPPWAQCDAASDEPRSIGQLEPFACVGEAGVLIQRSSFFPPQCGQTGFCVPRINNSNSFSQFLQKYS